MVSIIIPAYNAECYIKQCFESIIKQTYKNFEIIVVDDCSKDNTFKILQAYSDKYEFIKVYKNDVNMGVSKTRNFALSQATGDYIAFLDIDDMWENTKLEEQILLIENNPDIKFTYTGSAFINENGEKMNYVMSVPEKVSYKQLLKQNVISCSSVLIKKDLISGIKMKYDYTHEDFVMWLEVLQKEKYAYGINKPLLIYRISSNSKSSNKLKAAKMMFNSYKCAGLNIFQIIYYMMFYAYRSIKKYKNIWRG